MIVIFLLLVALFISVSDMSRTWLDSETQNILYYDSNSTGTNATESSEESSDNVVDSSEATKEQKSNTTQDTEQFDDVAMMQEIIEDINATKQKANCNNDGVANLNEILKEEVANEKNGVGLDDDLSDIDLLGYDDAEDEIQLHSRVQDSEEIKNDSEDLFNKFKDSLK